MQISHILETKSSEWRSLNMLSICHVYVRITKYADSQCRDKYQRFLNLCFISSYFRSIHLLHISILSLLRRQIFFLFCTYFIISVSVLWNGEDVYLIYKRIRICTYLIETFLWALWPQTDTLLLDTLISVFENYVNVFYL